MEANQTVTDNENIIGYLRVTEGHLVFFVDRQLAITERQTIAGINGHVEVHFLSGPDRDILREDPNLFQRTVLMYQGLPEGWKMANAVSDWLDVPTL